MKYWKEKIEDGEMKKSNKGLLESSFEALYELLGGRIVIESKLKDKHGTYGIETASHILCCKRSTYGYLVSITERALKRAISKNKKILLYIDTSKYFYEFDPLEIEKDNEINFKGEIKMVNFNIRMGINYTLKKEKEQEIIRKNRGMTKEDQETERMFKDGILS